MGRAGFGWSALFRFGCNMPYESIAVVTDAASVSVELYEFKNYARAQNFSAHDDILQAALNSAWVQCEQRTRRYFVDRTIDVTYSELDTDAAGRSYVRLPLGALSITTVTMRDEQGALVETLASTTYRLFGNRLVFTSLPSLPSAFGGLLVRYVAGFGTTASPVVTIPPTLKMAVMKLAMRNYVSDSGSDPKYEASLANPIPVDIAAELDQYKIELL